MFLYSKDKQYLPLDGQVREGEGFYIRLEEANVARGPEIF
jgi:hypothetical protein